MNIKKYIVSGCVALLGLGITSCTGDLDLLPNDPNLVDENSPNFKENTLAMCYSGIACEGYSGAGSSYISGMDGGASNYMRVMFMLSEFGTDEMIWIWTGDDGVPDIIADTWNNNNAILNTAYYRLLGHIAICNQYLMNTRDDNDAQSVEMRAEARVLRAYSYYNMLDLFGMSSFVTEETAGQDPVQISRVDLYNWLEKELVDIVDNRLVAMNPVYGRVGIDGAEGLLAKLYLNAGVFTGTPQWEKCQERCENIIKRHQGTGFNGSGLAEHYLYLFARDNASYMPGGDKPGENEILFGLSYNDTYTQAYGGTSFLISGCITNTYYVPRQDYGCSAEWSCIRGRYEMAERFYGISDTDTRDDLWVRGVFPAIPSLNVDEEDYSDRFKGFTGAWATTGGNMIIKFTGRLRNAAEDGGWAAEFPVTDFASTDLPIIRLADIYLMYTECYINGHAGEGAKALNYINYVRQRAGAPSFTASELTVQNLMDERSRELYLESWRRNDLVRNGMFAGPQQTIWQYKGSINNNEGTRIPSHYNLYPVPYNVLSSQPHFKQNPGY